MNAAAPQPRPRVGLVGVSGYARIYLHLVREAHEAGLISLGAAVVINPAEEAEAVRELQQRGATIYRDYAAMLAAEAGRLDLCLIPTGIQWHARMTVAALQAGMHVLVEKPLAGSLADVAAIRTAEAETGRWVAVGFQDIYAPENLEIKRHLCAGTIGRLRSVRVIGLWPRSTSYFGRNGWAGRLHADGAAVFDSPLNNAFAHFVNLALFFAGSTERVSTAVHVDEVELLRAHAIESFDTGVVTAHSPEDVRFWFGFSHTIRGTREPEIYLEGTHGSIEWRHEQSCLIRPLDGAPIQLAIREISHPRRDMFAAVLERFARADAPICDTAMAERHTAFIEDVHHKGSIRTLAAPLVDWQATPDSAARQPVVRGLEQSLAEALTRGSSLAQVGFLAEPLLAS